MIKKTADLVTGDIVYFFGDPYTITNISKENGGYWLVFADTNDSNPYWFGEDETFRV